MQVSARAQRLEPVSFVLGDSIQQRSQHQIRRNEQQQRIERETVAQSRGAAEYIGKGRDPGEEGDDGGGVEALRLRLPVSVSQYVLTKYLSCSTYNCS